MSRARTSDDIWWARILDRVDELLHNYPKLPKKRLAESRPGVREPGTGYYFRTMTAKLYRQGMAIQRWDFGNAKKHSRDPINDPADCNAPNLPAFQITIPICEVFWDPPYPIPFGYVPVTPTDIIGNEFIIDLYWIQQAALDANM
ncbi:17237_t:CDS:2 [Dentiscutata erythropus]|uniref:17237_t:CDS:1 n=1 Tax=Dentiscutata erythropus TaxID=1348616 RepID=A0A9N9P5T3_9GLOM|nr:17237_t:CDS:2 [Dentiscutata erythropus]